MEVINTNGLPEVSVSTVSDNLKSLRVIDVRTPEEFSGELGHISGAELIELGSDLMDFLVSADRSQAILFVCRSGARSGQATLMSRQLGFVNTYNMMGGMIEWNRKGLPTVK